MSDEDKKASVAPPSTTTQSNDGRRTIQSDRLKAIMKEFDRPLDGEIWTATPHAGENRRAEGMLKRIRRHRDHRQALKRARRAASEVYKVHPRFSTRKRASIMMGAGAMGLAAFTGPPIQKNQPKPAVQVSKSISQQDDVRKPAMLLKASDQFKQALIEEEGVRYTVYRDVAGYPTVGVGHLVRSADNLRVGDRISEKRVLEFLDNDLATAEEGVRILVGDLPLFQHEFDALLDLVYNVGLGNVSERESPRLNAAIAARDYDAIADELDYRHAGGQVARGLEFRSERRAKIFMDASYEDPREADSSITA